MSTAMERSKPPTDPKWSVPIAAAATTFLLFLNGTLQISTFPSIPGLGGLPSFYVPALAYFVVRSVMRRLVEPWPRWVEGAFLLLIAAGCAYLVFGSLATPFHRTCVEQVGEDCLRYALKPGADLLSALYWGVGCAAALILLRLNERAGSYTALLR